MIESEGIQIFARAFVDIVVIVGVAVAVISIFADVSWVRSWREERNRESWAEHRRRKRDRS